MLFYIVINGSGLVRFSPVPEVDKPAAASSILNQGFPLEIIVRACGDIGLQGDREGLGLSLTESKSKIVNSLKRALGQAAGFAYREIEWENFAGNQETSEKCGRVLADKELYGLFLSRIKGRQLAEGETFSLRQKLKVDAQTLLILMHQAVLNEEYEWVPAVEKRQGQWTCQRCGSKNVGRWVSVYGEAATCEECRNIGAVHSLQALFRPKVHRQPELNALGAPDSVWFDKVSFAFTSAQEKVARQLLALSGTGKAKEILVWAACGAGKTEITFPLIAWYLSAGRSVLFAAPRQDVVHDVRPRLEKNFPEYKVRILSGAVPSDWENSQLTVATTHQVLRFYRSFDLIIFDEMDAYPYAGNEILEFGLRQSRREDGKLIYLTATPSPALMAKGKKGECAVIRLPARYHGQPVPKPEWVKVRFPEKEIKFAEIANRPDFHIFNITLRELAGQGPLLVFVPAIAMVYSWVEILRTVFRDKRVEGSWSGDPERRRKVDGLRQGNIDIFICTSILERGITVSGIQVAVLYAHHELYNTRTLVQMAGRVGRTSEQPAGRAVFFAPFRTKAMREAMNWIDEQNTLARNEGFIIGQ
jgi:competence protein ComFA